MKKKPAGLAAFTSAKRSAAPSAETAPPEGDKAGRKRAPGVRAAGDEVALSLKIPRADWARLQTLAMDQRVTLRALMVRGLDMVFAEQGLPPISQ